MISSKTPACRFFFRLVSTGGARKSSEDAISSLSNAGVGRTVLSAAQMLVSVQLVACVPVRLASTYNHTFFLSFSPRGFIRLWSCRSLSCGDALNSGELR